MVRHHDGEVAAGGRLATTRSARWLVLAIALLVGCSSSSSMSSMSGHEMVAAGEPVRLGPEHGLVIATTTAHYLLVMDIIPPEQMYMPEELKSVRPDSGELVIRGRSTPAVDPRTRHVEVHVYDQRTGLVVTGAHPELTFVDHVLGVGRELDATEMRDIVLTDIDIHYGSNNPVQPGHPFTLSFDLEGDHAEFSGTMP